MARGRERILATCFIISRRKELKEAWTIFQDNGKGIPESILKELFAPLIRQKEIGTRGLGIAISPIPMNERNGSIFTTSEVGKGTIITLSLPNFAVPLQVTLAEQRQLVI